MNLDKYKIPAFQRKVSAGAQSLSKSRIIEESTRVSNSYLKLLEKETQLSKNKKITTEIKSVQPAQAKQEAVSSSLSTWRKMKIVAEVSQYFDKIQVVVLTLENNLSVGDRILIQCEGGLFEQTVDSMQIDRKDIQRAKRGDSVGMKVKFAPLKGGLVYKVVAQG